jgi:hypothetical protein
MRKEFWEKFYNRISQQELDRRLDDICGCKKQLTLKGEGINERNRN